MADYRIITDSACDMTKEFVLMNDISIIPLKYYLDGVEHCYNLDLNAEDIHDFYKKMKSGTLVTTAQINPDECENVFREILAKGEDILAISFSSALSGTFNSMRLAAEALKEEFPLRKIVVIDSLCASSGQGLFLYYAAQYKNQGLSIEESNEALLAIRPKIQHWFSVDDIDCLKRGGRINAAQAFMAKTLLIKPVLRVSIDGKLMSVNKKIGRKAALNQIIANFFEIVDKKYDQTVIISHADCYEDAKYISDKITEKAPINNVSISNIFFNFIGPVIGAHSGPGTIALFFVGSDKY